jgi:hypothetical protein
MMGIQWHPEAYITGAGRTEATPEARESSDRLFKGFNQAMRAYAGRQQVNEELLKRFSKLS